MMARILVLLAALLVSSLANAVCYRDGKPYPTGVKVDGRVCQADGTWSK
jgi:hypothetical protein